MEDEQLKILELFISIGFQANWDKVSFSLDYRQNSEKFLFHYWDQNYDNNRVMIYQNTTNDGVGVTVDNQLSFVFEPVVVFTKVGIQYIGGQFSVFDFTRHLVCMCATTCPVCKCSESVFTESCAVKFPIAAELEFLKIGKRRIADVIVLSHYHFHQ